jgi:hypothetical protein
MRTDAPPVPPTALARYGRSCHGITEAPRGEGGGKEEDEQIALAALLVAAVEPEVFRDRDAVRARYRTTTSPAVASSYCSGFARARSISDPAVSAAAVSRRTGS